MAKTCISNSKKKIVSKYPIRWNKECVKMSGLKHFSKTSNIYFFSFQRIGYCVVWQWDTFFTIFQKVFNRNVFYWRHLVHSETLPVTSKMSRTARSRPHLIRHQKWPPDPQNLTRNEKIQFTATTCSFRGLLQLNQLHIAHLEDSTAWFFTEYNFVFC